MSVDHAWRVLEQVNSWIRFADTKAVALMSASGVLGGWILAMFPSEPGGGQATWRVPMLVIALVAITLSISFALGALRPHLRTRSAGSLLHFAHAARRYGHEQDDFVQSCTALLAEDDLLIKEICSQYGINSTIANRKFRLVNSALIAFVLGLVLALVANLIEIL